MNGKLTSRLNLTTKQVAKIYVQYLFVLCAAKLYSLNCNSITGDFKQLTQ